MKKIFYILIVILPIKSFSQELTIIKDPIENFEIGVPVGWKYGVPKDKSINFVAYKLRKDSTDIPRENYNINIIKNNYTNIDDAFKYFQYSIGNAQGFKIIKEGEKTINKRRYKWLIETHKNSVSKEDMQNFVLFTHVNGKSLVLTMATTSLRFDTYHSLFDRVAESLKY